MNLNQILEKSKKELLAKENVVAVGIGFKKINGIETDVISIICSVTKKIPLSQLKTKDQIPKRIEGVMTDVNETGRIKALLGRTDRWRPAPPGVSIGHERITAGTFGCLVRKNNRAYILSNNHVLAESNAGAIGDLILQPGKYDGGTWPKDKIAELAEFIKIEWMTGDGCSIGQAAAWLGNLIAKIFGSKTRLKSGRSTQATNLVDAAIALPSSPEDVISEILEIGEIQGMNLNPALGLKVQKSGRTTGVTKGRITQVDVTVQVQYENNIALFEDQVISDIKCGGGDSGSIILDMDRKIVGLLFAGSDQDSITVFNRADQVWIALNLDMVEGK